MERWAVESDPLVQRAVSRNAAGKNLPTLGDELLQQLDVLEVDVLELLDTELADSLATVEELLLASAAATRAAALSAGSAAATGS